VREALGCMQAAQCPWDQSAWLLAKKQLVTTRLRRRGTREPDQRDSGVQPCGMEALAFKALGTAASAGDP